MAIRYPNTQFSTGVLIADGWRAVTAANVGASERQAVAPQWFQPSGLSRPGNAGTAYTGVWTGNVS